MCLHSNNLSLWDKLFITFIYFYVQYSELASEVCRGRGKVPVADYKVANYIDKEEFYESSDSGVANRSCYSFCMCPGGQVCIFLVYHINLNLTTLQ